MPKQISPEKERELHRYLFEGYSVKETPRALKNGLYLTPIEFLHATIAKKNKKMDAE